MQEYDVIIEGERSSQRTPTDLQAIYVRSERSGELIPLANFVTLEEFADSSSLNRYNRIRAITLQANLADGLALGQALTYMENLAREHLPERVIIDYKGISQDYKNSSQSILFVFMLGIIVVFLVLAAQFESWINPFVIMLTVPLAMAGGLLGLYISGNTLNLYSQIGLVMLIGMAAKNGILIVEFTNQMRTQGMSFYHAVLYAAEVRLRPIVMTAITTAAGALPLIFPSEPELRPVWLSVLSYWLESYQRPSSPFLWSRLLTVSWPEEPGYPAPLPVACKRNWRPSKKPHTNPLFFHGGKPGSGSSFPTASRVPRNGTGPVCPHKCNL